MFDKRLMELCPESRKFIVGNIVLQWIELFLNAVMIGLIASAAEKLYRREMTAADAILPIVIIAVTILVRFFTSRYAVRMSYLASRTVKRKMRDLIYKKLLKLGMSYREKVTTAELVQEAVEGVGLLEVARLPRLRGGLDRRDGRARGGRVGVVHDAVGAHQRDGGQNAEDGDHEQQLDEREAGAAGARENLFRGAHGRAPFVRGLRG
jgi:hypothetical protein